MPGPARRSVPHHVDRVLQAMAFLQEAVYHSRAAQASSAGLSAPSDAEGQCGLGEKAAIVLELTERGRALFQDLWPEGLAPAKLESLRETMSAWIERQDALDRKRNHFMKDFRQTHGFDRAAYTEAQSSDWDAGLAAVNDDINTRLRERATELLAETD